MASCTGAAIGAGVAVLLWRRLAAVATRVDDVLTRVIRYEHVRLPD